MIRPVVLVLTLVAIALSIGVAQLATSRVEYFPASFRTGLSTCGRPIVGDIEADWYPKAWRAAGEPSLYLASRSAGSSVATTYRFTWLRSFDHPVIVRVDESSSGQGYLRASLLSGEGGYDMGGVSQRIDRTLTADENARLRATLAASRVLDLPAADCGGGADGARWILEANAGGTYRYVNRWAPKQGPMRDVGTLMLGFTSWRFDRVY